MDGRPNCRNKAAFSNFSGVVWTLSQSGHRRLYGHLFLLTDKGEWQTPDTFRQKKLYKLRRCDCIFSTHGQVRSTVSVSN